MKKTNKDKVLSVLKGAAVAGVGTMGYFAVEGLSQVDFGAYTPVVAAGLAVVANVLRVFFPVADEDKNG